MPSLECISLPGMQRVPLPEASVLCLGNFDGVHLAHRQLLCAARQWRDTAFPDSPVGVFCFRSYPADSLLPEPPGHLCSPEERLSRFAACGMEFAILADFTELRDYSPEDYIRDVLIGQCRCVAVACGFNHRFGKQGSGTPELLRQMLGGNVRVQECVPDGGTAVSSTRIRALLAEGKPDEAARLLTQPYSLCAPVLHGKQLGRRIGAPTLNQNFPANAVLPKFGVYETVCGIDGICYQGVSNVGIHPTVDRNAPANCETYLLDFSGDVYGRKLTVSFLRFLRPEMRFDSVDALRKQIAADAEEVRKSRKA